MSKKTTIIILSILVSMLLGNALANQAPAIPGGKLSAQVVEFKTPGTYAVYSAPNDASLRGAKGKALVDTSEWVQVFGRKNDWLLIQYQISAGKYRIGWIKDNNSETANVKQLSFDAATTILMKNVSLTDDPLGSRSNLCQLKAGTEITLLSSLGSEWAYIAAHHDGKEVWGFIPRWTAVGAESTVTIQTKPVPKQAQNGKWGYVDNAGNFIIEAVYSTVYPFRGNYAIVSIAQNDEQDFCEGIIDSAGQWIVTPEYSMDQGYDNDWYGGYEHGIIYPTASNGQEYWFYLDTGYFSAENDPNGEMNLHAFWKNNSVVALVQNYKSEQLNLVRLDNGERIECDLLNRAVPKGTYLYAENPSDVFFHDGYLCVMFLDLETDETVETWFINECGESVKADSKYTVDDTACGCGLICARDNKTGLYGYLSMRDGQVAIKAQYQQADVFGNDGTAVVRLKNGEECRIDTEGNMLH